MNLISFDESRWYSIGGSFIQEPSDFKDYSQLYTLKLYLPVNQNNLVVSIPTSTTNMLIQINGENVVYQNANNLLSSTYKAVIIACPNSSSHEMTIKIYLDCYDFITKIPYINPTENMELIIGTSDTIYNIRSQMIMIDIVILSVFLLSSFFHFAVYYYRKNATNLYLAIFCLANTLIVSVLNQHILSYVCSDISPIISTRIYILASTLRIITVVLNRRSLMINPNIKKHTFILGYFNIAILIITLITPIKYIFMASIIWDLLYIYYLITTLIMLIIKNRKSTDNSTVYLAIGNVALSLGAISEFLFHIGVTNNLSSIYMYVSCIIFIYIQSAYISYTNTLAVINIQRLTRQLKETVFNLQENINTFISTHIKPSYLYETLDSIEGYIGKNQTKVDGLIQNLSKYLRQTLDVSDFEKTQSLTDELNFCKAYIYLIKEHNPSIKFIYEIPETYPNVAVPKFAIQALIENSVLHAFRGILKPQITISINVLIDTVEISVSDNGIGMSFDEIYYAKTSPISNVNIGIYHIDTILNDTLGTSLFISSEINKYTKASFSIPYDSKREENLNG